LLQIKGARETWQRERTDLTAKLTNVTREADAARSREVVWQIAEGLGTIRIHLAEKNFVLAKDAVTKVEGIYAKAAASLDTEAQAKLSPLSPLLSEIRSAADSLSPDATSKAQQATDLVHQFLEGVSTPAAAGGGQPPSP
jgi:hypothetical protein